MHRSRGHHGRGTGLFCAFLLLWAATAHGATRFVSPTGDDAADGLSWSTAKRHIQTAIDAADPNDQIWVAAGRYFERISLRAGVSVFGGFGGDEDPATFSLAGRDIAEFETIIDANSDGSVVAATGAMSPTTRLDGFTITNGWAEYGAVAFTLMGLLQPSRTTVLPGTLQDQGPVRAGAGGYT